MTYFCLHLLQSWPVFRARAALAFELVVAEENFAAGVALLDRVHQTVVLANLLTC